MGRRPQGRGEQQTTFIHPEVSVCPGWMASSMMRQSRPYERKAQEMNIGIIGAGHIGGTLTRRFSALGHKVFVANSRGPETLADLAMETGARPVSIAEAAQSGDVVI